MNKGESSVMTMFFKLSKFLFLTVCTFEEWLSGQEESPLDVNNMSLQ